MREKARIWTDMLIVIALTAAAAWVSVRLDPLERLHLMTKGSGFLDLDNLLLSIPVFVLSLAWFAWRRKRLDMPYLDAARRAEGERKATERRYQAIIEGSADAVTLVDERGEIRYVSPTAERVLGYLPEEAVGRSVMAFVHPEDAQAVLRMLDEVASEPGGTRRAQFRARHKDGSWLWIDAAGRNLIRDQDVSAIVINYRDVTQSKGLEDALNFARAGFESIVERNAEGVMVVDAEGVIRFANPAACAFLSASREVLVGSALGFPLEKGMVREIDISRGGEGVGVAEMRAVETEWEGSQAFLLTLRDMTEHLRAEEALRESEERYHTLFDNTSEGILLADESGRFLDVNQSFAKRLGYTREEILDMSAADIEGPESARLVKDRIREIHKTGRGIFEVVHRTKDGRAIPTEISACLINFGGSQAILCIARDITERKRADAAQSTLFRIAKAASTSSDLQELYRLVHEAVKEHMSARNFYIALYDAPSDTLSFPYWVDEMDPQPEPGPLGRGLTAYVLRHGEPALINEAAHEELYRQGEAELDGAPSKVWLGVPLKAGDRTIGVMAVQDYADSLAYGEEDLQLLEFVSGEVGQAIERSRSTQALRDSERRYREILENMEEGYYEVDLEGSLTFVNQAFCKMLGRSEEELRAMNYRQLMRPEKADETYAAFNKVFKTGHPAKATNWEMIRKDGSLIAIEASASPIRVSKKRYSGFRGVIRDVTERRQSERALRESEERYRDLVENSVDFIGTHDMTGKLLSANLAAARFYGYERPDQLVGRSLAEFIAPNFRPLFQDYLEAVKASGRTKGLMRIQTPQGEERIMAYDNTLKNDERGEPIVRTRGRDVTAEVRAQKALRESEELNRDLVENSVDLIATHDLWGKILSCNPAGARFFGYQKPGEIVGRNIMDHLAPEVRGTLPDYLEEMRAKGRGVGYMKVLTPSGEIRILAYNNTLKRNGAHGPVVRARGQDVTAKLAMEKALKASERRYRSLFQRNLAGVYRTDLQGRIIECNPAMAHLLGYGDPEELNQVRAERLYADPGERNSFIETLRRRGAVSGMERTLVKKDGTPVKALLSATLAMGEGKQRDVIEGTLIDVTERDQLAHQQMRTKNLETIASLASGVAHEVRNPLFAIQLNVSGLARRIPHEGETQAHMDHILAHVARLDQLIRGLMELGQAVDQEEFTIMDISAPLRGACLTVEEERPDFKGRILLKGPAESPVMRLVPRKITQAFIHLVRNAVEASPGGGTVRIVCEHDAETCDIRVLDEGSGLGAKIRANLFEPFVTTRTGQPGLGLALARHYVEAHGGTIDAKNNDPPPGATFTVRLPLASKEPGGGK